MAKITVAGNAVVVTSTLKTEEISKVKKYRPTELQLKGGEDGKEVIFAIGLGTGNGSITKYGIEFGTSQSEFATVTGTLGTVAGDLKAAIADQIGGAVMMLSKLEEKLPAVIEEINAEQAAILSTITVAG